jgi:hypothetical protein
METRESRLEREMRARERERADERERERRKKFLGLGFIYLFLYSSGVGQVFADLGFLYPATCSATRGLEEIQPVSATKKKNTKIGQGGAGRVFAHP